MFVYSCVVLPNTDRCARDVTWHSDKAFPTNWLRTEVLGVGMALLSIWEQQQQDCTPQSVV